MKAFVSSLLLAFLVVGCQGAEDAEEMDDGQEAEAQVEEQAAPATAVTEDLYVEYMAQTRVLMEQHGDDPHELTRKIEELDDRLGVTSDEVNEFTEQLGEDVGEMMRIQERVTQRAEELKE